VKHALLSGGIGLAFAGAAHASTTVVSMTYSDLSGNYTASSATEGIYTARAVDLAGILRSAGNVSRLVPGNGVADFQPGFVSGADFADFVLSLSVTHGDSTGTGIGSFTATDADGDTITGNISGNWSIEGDYIAFVGVMSNVLIQDLGAQDHTFNGSNTGSWDTNFTGYTPPFDGAVVKLTEQTSNFFATNFSNAATGLSAQITSAVVPLPSAAIAGSLALAGLGAARGLRRRKA